jgi:UDP-glucose 4-epimerase
MSISFKSALVVGSNGYLGSNLSYQLIEMGVKVKLADISENSIISSNHYSQIDFTDRAGIREILKDIEIVFFFAGKTGDSQLGFNQPDQFILGNEVTLVNLLNVIKDLEIKPKVIFPSTRLIYQGSESEIDENSILDPKSVYSVNKLACENYLKIFGNCFDIDYTIFRISLPFGSIVPQYRLSYGVMSYLVNLAMNKQPLKIYGDGKQIGSLIHIQDLVNILIYASSNSETNNQIFNVGGPDHFQMGEVVKLIASKFDVGFENVNWPDISRKTDQGNLIFSSEKILNILDYKFKFNFKEWLNQIKQ